MSSSQQDSNSSMKIFHYGDELTRRSILYAPDYIVNAGGTVFDTDRLGGG